ncbi:MAG: response regulator [Ruminiclostridium sp.]|nr:response regulator [Ruminiclostridium sp.]
MFVLQTGKRRYRAVSLVGVLCVFVGGAGNIERGRKMVKKICAAAGLAVLLWALAVVFSAAAGAELVSSGGGYAVSKQIEGVGYAAKLYNAESGLPTSDANCIMSASDGYIWIGGYSGIIRYDGSSFERLDASDGLTNGRAIFEDSKGRIWVGTNDNGVVLIDGEEHIRYTYKEGLASSSVRGIAEGGDGTVYIGLTSGVAYVGEDMVLHSINDARINTGSVNRLVSDSAGKVYGNTRNGEIFCLENGALTAIYSGDELGIGSVTTICADPDRPGTVYLGTYGSVIYCGAFGDDVSKLREISVSPAENICWITGGCGRIWLNSGSVAGYLDENDTFRTLDNIPLNNAIEMMTTDYQGNLWYASTRQGVMKVVTSNFLNITDSAGLPEGVVNSTCLHNGMLYIGTDKGLQIVGEDDKPVENELTEFIGDARIRCITEDNDGTLWISTYTDGMGLVCQNAAGDEIGLYNTNNGLASDLVRCTTVASDGSLLVGTNGGLTVIKDGIPVKTYGAGDVIKNTVFLTVEEGMNGEIYVGTDGDGIYVIEGDDVRRLGREDGLTSDVIMRIKRDDARGVYWMITSNSVQYMKDGIIHEVKNFPYNNNFDLYFGAGDDIWILASYGIYCVKGAEMLGDGIKEFAQYNTANGLPSIPTGNSFSATDDNGSLYIAGRSGVSRVNIYRYFEHKEKIKVGIRSVTCGTGEIKPDENGTYTLPSDAGRIQIKAAILDYSMTDPLVHIFLEENNDPGITAKQSGMFPLEFTGLPYGKYTFRIQLVNGTDGSIYQDESYRVVKQPEFFELTVVRVGIVLIMLLLAGLIVWRVMTSTIIRRQYEQIRVAKEEAERANSAKSRFLANMSHEIRTPINTIMGMDEMILREDASDVPDEYHKTVAGYAMDIRSASESLLGLVNDLLDMSKIESGKMHLVEQEYDTQELLRSIVTMIRVRSSQKDLTFDVDIDGELPVRLYGDAGKIKQIVLNLLTNAVKYTEKGGFTLKAAVTGREGDKCSLRISVKDTGIGVKPEDMDKLFSAYERLDEEKNSGIQGTGLGLDISRRFAGLMNGELWCESVYGEGSEFILTFEQKIIDGNGIGEFTERGAEISKGPYVPLFTAPDARILVVDDNPMNLTVIKGLLKATKMSVTTAASGEECLELLEKESFNVVLLDHMMPGMDGLETVAKIRETMPELPVYALTANATAGGDEFYRSKGFNGYLSKPIDSPALEKAIKSHLPAELLMEATAEDAVEDAEELPEDMLWINDVEGIDVAEGIKNSGGVSSFIYSLNMFNDTIDGNSEVIENSYNDGDLRLYTVKVHALKSSARIIGATALSKLAEALELAGNKQDTDFINANTGSLMTDYRAYKEKLSPLNKESGEDGREPIPEDELKDAYDALKEVIPQMDYDAVEMIISQLNEYRLPDGDREKIAKLEKMLRTFDWDGMEELIGDRA